MFEFLSKLFRRKTTDLEANLYPTPECAYGGKGEIEIETWSDGERVMEVSIKHSGIDDGAELEFCCNGECVAILTASRGYAKHKFSSADDVHIPEVRVGDEAEIRLRGAGLYRGRFKRD